jgi:hypothetical protein
LKIRRLIQSFSEEKNTANLKNFVKIRIFENSSFNSIFLRREKYGEFKKFSKIQIFKIRCLIRSFSEEKNVPYFEKFVFLRKILNSMYFSLLRKIELNNEFRKIRIFTKFFKFAVFFSTEKDRIKQRIFKNSYFYENF